MEGTLLHLRRDLLAAAQLAEKLSCVWPQHDDRDIRPRTELPLSAPLSVLSPVLSPPQSQQQVHHQPRPDTGNLTVDASRHAQLAAVSALHVQAQAFRAEMARILGEAICGSATNPLAISDKQQQHQNQQHQQQQLVALLHDHKDPSQFIEPDARPVSSHAPFPFQMLPVDVIRHVASFCRPAAHLNLALTSHRLFELVWPVSFASLSAWPQLTARCDLECSTSLETRFIFQAAVSSQGNRVAFIDEIDSSGSSLSKRMHMGTTVDRFADGFLGRLNVWDVERRITKTLTICRKKLPRSWRCSISCLEFSLDGRFVALAGENLLPPDYAHSIGVFQVETDRCQRETTLVVKRRMYRNVRGITSVSFSPDGLHFAVVSSAGLIDVYLFQEDILERTMLVHEAQEQLNVEVLNVAYSPAGEHIVTTTFNSAAQEVSFQIFNAFKGTRVRTMVLPNDGGSLFARSIPSISYDGARVALTRDGFFPKTISREVWNLNTHRADYTVTDSKIPTRGVIPYRKIQTLSCRFTNGPDGPRLLLFSVSDLSVSKYPCVVIEAVDVDSKDKPKIFPMRSASLTDTRSTETTTGTPDYDQSAWIDSWVCDSLSSNGRWAVVVTEAGKLSRGRMRQYRLSVRNLLL